MLGGTNPSRFTGRLRLLEDELDRRRGGLAGLFASVTRHELRTQTTFLRPISSTGLDGPAVCCSRW